MVYVIVENKILKNLEKHKEKGSIKKHSLSYLSEITSPWVLELQVFHFEQRCDDHLA